MKEIAADPRYLPLIFQSIPHGIFTIDESSNISAFNRTAEEITGYLASEAVGKKCYDIFRADICEKECPLKRSVDTMEKTDGREVTILNKFGKKRVISIYTAALSDEDGTVIGGVEMFRDISQLCELRKKVESAYSIGDIVTRNPAIRRILEQLPLFAGSPSTVLIEGPSGTGKELIARALHNQGPRADKPFIKVNCAALPDGLLESELFGYVKGAFTDAKKDKPGRFKLAHTGSILLDEIGEISLPMQSKLLRVLQEREFEPLGGIEPTRVDVRVIAATNRNLDEEVKKGRFREDLFYRLNVIRIRIPALSERREDIPLLVSSFIERFNRLQGRRIERISERALAALMTAPFQGNVRELENAIEYAFVVCTKSTITLGHLPPQYAHSEAVKIEAQTRDPLAEAEAEVIRSALELNGGNRTKTARELEISRNTLWRKMKRLNID